MGSESMVGVPGSCPILIISKLMLSQLYSTLPRYGRGCSGMVVGAQVWLRYPGMITGAQVYSGYPRVRCPGMVEVPKYGKGCPVMVRGTKLWFRSSGIFRVPVGGSLVWLRCPGMVEVPRNGRSA